MPWVTMTTISVSDSLRHRSMSCGLEAGPGEGVERPERLVEEQRPRLDRERPGHGGALLHAARHLGRLLVLVLPEPDGGEVPLARRRRPARCSNPGRAERTA